MLMHKRTIPVVLAAACLLLGGVLWLHADDKDDMKRDGVLTQDQMLKIKGMLADKGFVDSVRDDIGKDDKETQEVREEIYRAHVAHRLMDEKDIASKIHDLA